MKLNVPDEAAENTERFIREACITDLDFLEELESLSFSSHRRSSRRSLRNSILSRSQLVYVAGYSHAGYPDVPVGATVLLLYKRTVRIYSIAVLDEFRMKGYGEMILNKIIELTMREGYDKLSLEVDESDAALVEWYKKFGFEKTHSLFHYYAQGEHACRMSLCPVAGDGVTERIVAVVENVECGALSGLGLSLCSANTYLTAKKYSCTSRYHVLNFCRSYKTHSVGYYVSMLASARNHRITPSVMSVKDASSKAVAQSIFEEMEDVAAQRLQRLKNNVFDIVVIFGETPDLEFAAVARKLFSLFEIPFFRVHLERKKRWELVKIYILYYRDVCNNYESLLRKALLNFCRKKRYNHVKLKSYKYDLAILVDPAEKTPPSCSIALKKFRRVAEEIGFFVEFITKQDCRRLCEFDALFIRETTAIENHTYAMARYAYTEGLVVIDDPWSILLCSNKVYLHERLANAGVPQPEGFVLTKEICTSEYLASLPLPLVLKLPESSFSQGVYMVSSFQELVEYLNRMFKRSALVVAQEFMKSEYDWRVGVMDNTPLFACKYYMASGHWQIYNWHSAEGGEFSGRSETLHIKDVPVCVMKAALKAVSLIGNGLYGVDLKEVNGRAYVIEVNDNPNIDASIEDLVLGDELYLRIMQSIFNRIEVERLQKRSLI
ncbi:MAG: GNAT family N-acetyltransferase [Kiritimatiellia bacterium]